MIVICWILMGVSFLLALAGVLFFVLRRRQDPIRKRLLVLTLALIIALLLSRLSTWLTSGQESFPPTIFIDLMQAFSLDAPYDELLTRQSLFASETMNRLLWIYVIVLYSAAPIAGGAVIYDVLAGVSPRVTLFLRRRRPLYIFSELNECSVTLAEDILRTHSRVAVVFTGVAKSDDEEENELRMRARAMGAILLQDDISHSRGFRRSRKCLFFLMNYDSALGFEDEENLSHLQTLLPADAKARHPWNPRRDCDIFMLTNDSGTVENIRSIKEDFDTAKKQAEEAKKAKKAQRKKSADNNLEEGQEKKEEENKKKSPSVQVHVVRDYTQTSCTLLKTTPLYDALGPKAPPAPDGAPRKLRVVLFGSDPASREMFKTVFWCGQLLDTQLYITVVCDEPSESRSGQSFEDFLRRDCPELLESARWDQPECLRVRLKGNEYAAPYCGLTIIKKDLGRLNIRDLLGEEQHVGYGSNEPFRLADCDYFLVSEGGDKAHIELAAALRDGLLYHALRDAAKGKAPRAARPIIAYAIRDDGLAEIVQKRFEKDEKTLRRLYAQEPPQMISYGTLRARFSWENVSMNEEYLAQRSAALQYDPAEHGSADLSGSSDDLYNSWAGIGRLYHLPYKMYSIGCLSKPPVDDTLTDEDKILVYVNNALAYFEKLRGDPALTCRLFWLEHRRWNAFTRALGFTRPFEQIEDVTACFGPPYELDSFLPALLKALERLSISTDPVVAQAKAEGKTNDEIEKEIKTLTGNQSEEFFNSYKHGDDPAPKGSIPRIYALKSVKSRLHPCLVESAPTLSGAKDFDLLDIFSATRTLDGQKLNDIKKHDTPLWKYLPALDRAEALRLRPDAAELIDAYLAEKTAKR